MGDGAAFTDRFWTSPDGLKLHYRDYPGREDRPLLLCLPGLTRNARDFDPVANAFAGEWRVISVDLRGRGESDYAKDAATYNPLQYVADIEALLEQAGISRFVAIGTSLGGILTMLLAAGGAERIAGAVLNDIGPVLEPAGVARIRDYVGQGRSFPTWMHAARALKESGGAIFPDYAITDWLAMAKRVMAVGGNGRIAFDYDMKIAEPFNAPSAQEDFDLWPAYRALAGRPVLVIRGALSDLLSAATVRRMMKEVPGAESLAIRRVGHPPSLEEPGVKEAIANLLAKVE
ncbi:alpha/beta hydrolase [Altererythrobacter sp. CC-YST694]|uniref:alpha/beta fold hydrolase n=1 Tax=Altererythrobacter sp. CC-YST694 TaxID=2755038 RepID=UPI001D00737B|nr:alpha/beta hydrolase [Altererythrobacter sp. CC-YST694]MCB5424030.1 alpha/beta hydrolase [Altererythrobacter sp. CC-YST694]